MLLGDQGEITPLMRQNFSRTGTSHLLVINGLHLGMVAAVTYFLSFWLLRRFPLAAVAGQRGQDRHPGGGDPGGVLCLGGRGVALHPAGRSHGPGLPAAGLLRQARGGLERPGPGGPGHPEPHAPAPLYHLLPALLCGGGRVDLYTPPPGGVDSGAGVGPPHPGSGGPPAFPNQRVVYGVGGGHPGHRAPGGLLLPGGLPPGHPGQPGGHSPGPAPGPAVGGGRGHLPGLIPDPGGPSPALRGQTPPVAGLSGD